MRNKDLRESSDAIEFLTSEVTKSSLITMKDAINELVQSRLEMQMMAKINNEYILKLLSHHLYLKRNLDQLERSYASQFH